MGYASSMSTRASAPADERAQTEPAVLAEVERGMIRVRRSVSRRVIGRRSVEEVRRRGLDVELNQLMVIDAVEEGPDPSGQAVTVGMVADRLAIDPSRASRIVSETVKAGHIRRVASQTDSRQIHLELTDQGRDAADAMHTFRRAAFDEAMAGWSDRDRAQFARLLTRFTQA